jgi:aminoglycoside 2''-phosphotransferase
MLKGEEFSPELVSSLTEAEADSAARQLAEFLTLLHRLAAEIAVSYGIADSRDEHSRDMLDKAVKLVSPRLSAEENAYMLWNLSRLEAVLRTSRPIVPIHLDLGYEHILYDRSCNQVNVIDFGDLSLGDPAYDFVGFYDFDDSFLNLVYGYYAGFKDETLLRRAKVYYDCFPISMMKDALDGYPVDFEYAYNLFDRKRRKSLMDGYGDPSY